MSKKQKLTIKQKKFADEYIKISNASESYKKHMPLSIGFFDVFLFKA